MSRQILIYCNLIVTLNLLLIIVGCSETAAEQQIQAQMENMQQAITNKSLSNFMTFIAKDFAGNKSLSRNELHSLLYLHFQRNRNIDTFKWQADIELVNELAKVKIYVVFAASNNNMTQRGRLYTINSVWQNRNNEWIVTSADWQDTILAM